MTGERIFFHTAFSATILALLLTASCNSDRDIYSDPGPVAPSIWFDSSTSVYTARPGEEVVITPTVKHGMNGTPDDPSYTYSYTWVIDGATVSDEKVFRRTFDREAEIFVTLHVTTEAGSGEKEARIDITEPAPPLISMNAPAAGIMLELGQERLFSPEVKNGAEAGFEWTLDGETVGTDQTYTFRATETGHFVLSFTASNEGGEDTATVTIEVVEKLPLKIFPVPASSFDIPATIHASVGRAVYFNPVVENAKSPVYSWTVDGQTQQGADKKIFAFTPSLRKDYEVTFTVTDDGGSGPAAEAHYTYTVKCYGEESTLKRPATGNKTWDRVWEYTPGPGQFINETLSGYDNVATAQAACSYAEKRLRDNLYVSLGGFGGYIIVGFDHSIENKGGQGYDFSITGNQTERSSEPGIVWVMQDVNGDGRPNDIWYELRGSETGKAETLQDYAVTYYRPAGPGMNVQWSDNRGEYGTVDYAGSFHRQDYYYPLWVTEDDYTLYGTRLASRTYRDPATGFWHNPPFDWGYADNYGQDRTQETENGEADPMKTYFRISNAINPDMTPANLQFIDFIKVQSGVNANAGSLGENSPEVFGFGDENL